MSEENARATRNSGWAYSDTRRFARDALSGGRTLGVRSIVLPLAALLVNAILHKSLAAKPLSDIDGGLSIVLGIVLLLVSLLLRSGAEQAAEAR